MLIFSGISTMKQVIREWQLEEAPRLQVIDLGLEDLKIATEGNQ